MRRDLVEMLDEYKLLTMGEREVWRHWTLANTEFDGEQEEKEFCEALAQIDTDGSS
ncbi:MAG: hypothetical protein QF619_11125 [Candidatus Binatia bacterium]|jgi:hypothetical protein|nr:hypothetical protein [Candidatus Binatia bacterium]